MSCVTSLSLCHYLLLNCETLMMLNSLSNWVEKLERGLVLFSPCLQWALYAITPYVYQIYRPHYVRGDILHIVSLLRKEPICVHITPRAGRDIQIHTGVIAHIYTASAHITPAVRDHLHAEICTVLPRERADIEVAGYKWEMCFYTLFTHKHTEYDWQGTTRHTVCHFTLTLPLSLTNYPLITFCCLLFPRIPISLSRISLFISLFFSLFQTIRHCFPCV